MAKHLNFSYYLASYRDRNEAFKDIEILGITYQHRTPQPMGDCCWYWNCENIPEVLPSYITEFECEDPTQYIGWGLSKEDAEKIKNYEWWNK